MDVEKTMEFILDQLAQVAALQAAAEQRQAAAEQRQARSDARLDRAIRLAVWEARQERKKRRAADEKLDEYITRLAAAQLITEEKLQRFIEERRGGNGKG
jgi:hypothetical protein